MTHKYLTNGKEELVSWTISDLLALYLSHLNVTYLASVVTSKKLLYLNNIQTRPKNRRFTFLYIIVNEILFCVTIIK